jgi:DNA polymerase-3 subunit alpha
MTSLQNLRARLNGSEHLSFVHLQVHSQYSLLEATCEFNALCERVKALGMPAVAITDYGNMFGAAEFYFIAQKHGIKPILGLEVYIAPKSRFIKGEDPDASKTPNRRLVLLAQNYKGYQELCQISTKGYQEGFYYRPRIDDDVLKMHSENIIALSGSFMGDIPWTFRTRGKEAADARIQFYKEIYGDRFYLEVNRTGLPEWREMNEYITEAAKKFDVAIVAANDVHFIDKKDQVAQEVLICIGSNKTLHDPARYRLGTDQFYLKSPEEMHELFKDIPEAVNNTLVIADRCNIKFELKTPDGKPIYHLPSFKSEKGHTEKEEIRILSEQGLEVRHEEALKRDEDVTVEKRKISKDRLDYELKIIDQMGFNGYFLIVQDFINWAKANDIPVGPGRGSGAGSLVAYSLGITDLDPMSYNLIFERFLNPERISLPDFDVDFCQEHRGRVINYVTEKYGADSVAQIITYGKLQAKAAIRDVGRVLGMLYAEVDVVSKLMPEKLGLTLKMALEMEPRLRDLMEDDPKIATLLELAQQVEGLTRHAGIHAAGVIIADGKIINRAPLYRGTDNENVVQYDMKHAEKLGLIKFDFLGLKTLTYIHEALKLVKKNRGKTISTKDISLKDPGVYEIMCKGDTAGIFQFEGEGITDLIIKAQPNCFEDIVAINALYRPGPMDMIPDYLERKHGRKKVSYLFPELEDVLKETYGIVVYQEQVQLIAARIASYSLGEADVLRRAMGKKIASEMDQQKSRFLEGAKKNNHDAKKAEELFDLMAKFAEYGFNKSHAAAYCVIAAQTAYLKNYYPVECYAALLSTEMSDTDKIVKYVKDARRRGINVLPPHINGSEFKFTVQGEDIIFSLGAIKGVGEAAVEAIIEARSNQPDLKFNNLNDFFTAVDLRRVNKKTIESLIKAGALDNFGPHRAQLYQEYVKYIDRAEIKRKDIERGQSSLFDLLNVDEPAETRDQVILEPVAEWTRSAKLAFEKEVLGFYLSGHPLDSLEGILRPYVSHTVQSLIPVPAKSKVQVAGLISALREVITKKGTRMAFGGLEDTTSSLDLVIFPDVFAQAEVLLKSDAPLVISGILEKPEANAANDKKEGEPEAGNQQMGKQKILVDKVTRVEDLIRKSQNMVIELQDQDLKINPNEFSAKLALLKEVLQKSPGTTRCTLRFYMTEVDRMIDLEISEPNGILPTPQLIEQISTVLKSPRLFLQ